MTIAENQAKPSSIKLPEGLLEQIVAHLNPQRVYLFGSQARGDTHRDSDWDFLVVVDDDLPAERIGWRALFEAYRGIPAAIDLIPCRISSFRERVEIIGSLPWIVKTHGLMVYERSFG